MSLWRRRRFPAKQARHEQLPPRLDPTGRARVTRLMVRVADAREATQAAIAGVDAVELFMMPPRPVMLDEARAVRRAFPGTLRLRFAGLSVTAEMAATATATDAQEIALALDAMVPPIPVVDVTLPRGMHAIAMIAAGPDQLEAIQRVRDRVSGIMLDTADAARLVDQSGIARLDAFASACEAAGLPFGLAGGLEAPDVARLLLLRPDVLGFDAAMRIGHRPDGALDPQALDAIRALIPRDGHTTADTQPKQAVTDRIFVRDFVSLLSIGAYQAEHAIRQRVRFSVEADVLREPVQPRDMRDVFSYDVIIETIRVLSQRAHVTFVETLAEEIAASLLTHAELVRVIVKVEKLDVIDGAVGIEIVRRRGA